MEGMLGQVPSWMEDSAEPASERSWRFFRDLNLGGNTRLSGREKALIGIGVAAMINCPYYIYSHTEEAQSSGVMGEEFREVVNPTVDVKYFSTVLHGNGVDPDGFKAKTDEIVECIAK